MSKSEVCNYRDELKEIELRLQMEKVFLVDGNNYIMQNISVSRYKPGRRILTILKKQVRQALQWIIYLRKRYKLKMQLYFDKFYDRSKRQSKKDMVIKIRLVSYAKKLLKKAKIPIEKVWLDADRPIRFEYRRLAQRGIEAVIVSRDSDFWTRGCRTVRINIRSAAGQRGRCGFSQLRADRIEESQGSKRAVQLMLLQISQDQRKATTIEILSNEIEGHSLDLGITDVIRIAAENTSKESFKVSFEKAVGNCPITRRLWAKFYDYIEDYNCSLVFTGNGDQLTFYHQATADQLMKDKGLTSGELKMQLTQRYLKLYSVKEAQRYEGESQDQGEEDQLDPHWLPAQRIEQALDQTDLKESQFKVEVPPQAVESPIQEIPMRLPLQPINLSTRQVPLERERVCPDDSRTYTKKTLPIKIGVPRPGETISGNYSKPCQKPSPIRILGQPRKQAEPCPKSPSESQTKQLVWKGSCKSTKLNDYRQL